MFSAMPEIDETADPVKALALKWTAKAEAIADDETRLECLALIGEWLPMRRAVAALSSSADVQSYSIAGRTVTRASLVSVRREADALADQIRAMLGEGGGALVADLRRAFIP